VHTSEGFVFGPAGRTSVVGPAEHPDTNTPGQYRSLMINDQDVFKRLVFGF